VKELFNLSVPDKAMCPGHDAPLDYLCRSFLDQKDLLVWANRGGGKTMLAAVATLLDAVFNAPVRVRVLGGSFDQSDRLGEYIREMLLGRDDWLRRSPTRQRVALVGGSEIRMLAQSQRAVRGQHVQKVRCDEVDLFDSGVWRAVQFVTRSRASTRGAIEVLSTLHRSGGLMDRLVRDCQGGRDGGFGLVRWCLWEVIERCEPARRCEHCPLAEDCRGRAREAAGFFAIEDAIAIKSRSSRQSWQAEMLCKGARNDWLVFQEFDPALHVRTFEHVPDWPQYRAIDFGYTDPLVCLWIQVSPGGCVQVIDEYVQTRRSLEQHAPVIRGRHPWPVRMTFVDPSGTAKESTSGKACVELLEKEGIACRSRPSTIAEGLELIRAALAPACGEPALAIHPRCRTLIDAMGSYHYPPPESGRGGQQPVKDGPDHVVDALRYFFVNCRRPRSQVRRKRY
jgi:hypothetical protein